jgi:protein-L-isoaspartate(D-aspartate) O-methyltransferase
MKFYPVLPVIVISLLFTVNCRKNEASPMKNLRESMVRNQITSRGITDSRVISAMLEVERDKFAPGIDPAAAYGDHPAPIGHGQTISQPYIVALMSELCRLKGGERVLEIGTGSGYQTAVLSKLAKEVYTIEIVEPLGISAKKRLDEMKYSNISFKIGDGYRGWPDKAPFDVIILTAAPPRLPAALVDQLSDKGGIMVAPVGSDFQELKRIVKSGGKLDEEFITHVRFVPMVEKNRLPVNGETK